MSVRWGFLGAGWIARTALAPAVHAAAGADLTAVASRAEARSQALEPQRVHATYQDLLDDDEIDAVYICLANHQHLEWATKALHCGKHVLCEKPLTLSAHDTDQLIATAEESDLLLVEAVWSRWHPRMQRLQELARSGALGQVRTVDAAFTFPGEHAGNYRARRDMGGGALLDVGCYLLHGLMAAVWPNPSAYVREVHQDIGYTDVDLTTRFRVHSGMTEMTGLASIASPESQLLIVRGTHGEVSTHQGQAFSTWCESSSLKVDDHIEEFPVVDAYQLMIEAVSRRIIGSDDWLLPLEETRAVARLTDAIEEAAAG